MKTKNQMKLKEILNEEEYVRVERMVEDFRKKPLGIALNILFSGTVKNTFLERNLSDLGINDIPRSAYPIIFREMRKSWEENAGGQRRSFIELPENCTMYVDKLIRTAQTMKVCTDGDGDHLIIVYTLVRRVVHYVETKKNEIDTKNRRNMVEREIFLLTSKKVENRFGAIRELNFHDDEANAVLPLAELLGELMKVMYYNCKKENVPSMPAVTAKREVVLESQTSEEISSTESKATIASDESSTKVEEKKDEDISSKIEKLSGEVEKLISAFIAVAEAMKELGIEIKK